MSSHALLLLEILLNLSFFLFRNSVRSYQLLQRLTEGASFDQIGLTLQFHRVATGGLSLFGGFCKKFLPNFEQTCYSTNFHIKYISHNCVKWVTSKYPSINWQTWGKNNMILKYVRSRSKLINTQNSFA